MKTIVRHSAIIDGPYRYSLTREWGDGAKVCWVMLNPSTADADVDDPTIRRCIRFADDWGYDGIEVVNLYALRATDPRDLTTSWSPVGPYNRNHLGRAIGEAGMVVAAWGANKAVTRNPVRHDILAMKDVRCLGVTKFGYPKHPLYVKATTQPVPIRDLIGRDLH